MYPSMHQFTRNMGRLKSSFSNSLKIVQHTEASGSSIIVSRLNLNTKYTINLKASLNNYRADLLAALS